VKSPKTSFYVGWIKPVIDFLAAFIALVVLLPVFVVIYILLKIMNGGKVYFLQERIGFNEKLFVACKFRTMNDAKNRKGELLPDAERITPLGHWIRKTSLDELPQLFNVLKGDMSFIGPRPLLPEYLPFYNEKQRQRHLVKPGITGLAQVNGRNLTTWDKRFEFDIQYIENVSWGMDLLIIIKTIVKVLTSEGISADGHATMPKFSDYMKSKSR